MYSEGWGAGSESTERLEGGGVRAKVGQATTTTVSRGSLKYPLSTEISSLSNRAYFDPATCTSWFTQVHTSPKAQKTSFEARSHAGIFVEHARLRAVDELEKPIKRTRRITRPETVE